MTDVDTKADWYVTAKNWAVAGIVTAIIRKMPPTDDAREILEFWRKGIEEHLDTFASVILREQGRTP